MACKTKMIIKSKNAQIIERITDAFHRNSLCEEFIPIPKELEEFELQDTDDRFNDELFEKYGADCLITWCSKNWGTSLDVGFWGSNDFDKLEIVNPSEIRLNVQTSRFPPILILDKWVDLGCDVRGSFVLNESIEPLTYENKEIREWLRVDRTEAFGEVVQNSFVALRRYLFSG